MDDLIMKANNLEDTRQAWKIKHNLVDILVIVMLSVLTGHNDFEEMVIFAEARLEILRKYIKLENGDLLNARNMEYEIEDGVLHYLVDYSFIGKKVEIPGDMMEQITIE